MGISPSAQAADAKRKKRAWREESLSLRERTGTEMKTRRFVRSAGFSIASRSGFFCS